MTTGPFSQMHNLFGAQANPFAAWNDAVQAQVKQASEVMEQLAKLEKDGVERMTAAVDEMAKLTKQSMKASLELQAEWRRIALETVSAATPSA
ncbi:MAG TPA: hypothetical protein RMH85_31440 [Polyangiaceae bacterium LLY-WYZ-15_(1-7)]|nr:hypothetical protein [Polyangiaceae bacterium LLY-WYZ-15_(1-7)]HJL01532.1 hypothetical protein [Polyangiaceae bacterium LLY-WYZ-15_(1-7)]HJL13038.1 hypothetical protein [Polyangiaceae bacterium LLY-WYZ-15_(1-7)]HJL23393.1 hypothetical protein [Polyangiaceae bacterium LLY-WYZ-15_(1-7)]HJL29110.1 hypothetical protein [Polyangiaceae bacterium LLY-WYZ-15_(1-7)]